MRSERKQSQHEEIEQGLGGCPTQQCCTAARKTRSIHMQAQDRTLQGVTEMGFSARPEFCGPQEALRSELHNRTPQFQHLCGSTVAIASCRHTGSGG
jgi:hypothetical protein